MLQYRFTALEKARAGRGESPRRAGPGDHFGELSLLDGGPRRATACTLTACECLTVERDAFQRCLLSASADDLGAVQGLDVMGRLCKALLPL